MKILIVGATGNLGRLTAALLAERGPGIQLRLTSHREEGRKALAEAFPSAEVMDADWYDRESLARAFKGVDKALMVTPDFTTDEEQACANVIAVIRNEPAFQQLVRLIALAPDFKPGDVAQEHMDTRTGAGLHAIAKPILDAATDIPLTYINAATWIAFNLPWMFAQSIKTSRKLYLPSMADTKRPWVTEGDIAAVMDRVLSGPASDQLGRTVLLTDDVRYTFKEIASLIGDVIGQPVEYVDDVGPLPEILGEAFPVLMTYWRHETPMWSSINGPSDFEKVMGRPQTSLRQYIESNRSLFE